MEKEKKKISCSYALLVVILFAVVCFLTVYIVVDRKLNENKDGSSTNSNVSENANSGNVENGDKNNNVAYETITDEELENLITDEIDFIGTTRLTILNRVNSIDEITNQQKLSYALKLLEMNNDNKIPETFTSVELENVFKNSILGNLTLKNEDIIAIKNVNMDGNPGYGYTYHDGIYDNLVLTNSDVGAGINYMSYKLLSISSENNKYMMSVKYLWGVFSDLDCTYKLYSNPNDFNSVLYDFPRDMIETSIEAKKWASDNFETYENQLSTYNYTFVKENGIIKLVDFSVE